jgi:hypothetical protein
LEGYKYDFDIEHVRRQLELAASLSVGKGTPQERIQLALSILEPMRWKSIKADSSIAGFMEELLRGLTGVPWEERGIAERRDLSMMPTQEVDWYFAKIESLKKRCEAEPTK